MKQIKLILALFAILMGASAAQAGGLFKFGPKVGLTVNEMHFNNKLLDSDNKAGWTAGLMTEFRVPVIGIGADLSAMYVRRNTRFLDQNGISDKNNRDYIEIPLNLRYNFGLPVVGKFLTPYLAVGPSVSVLTSRKSFEDFRNKSVDWALNFGIGVQLINHIDVSARYGLGLTKAVNAFTDMDGKAGIQGKNRYWTVSVAYLF
ncbi:MAG: porin family protein [Duncaniella sp.]|nr:porin family protein [Duncaniella sp.]